jgi:hypothetical protein
MEGRLSARIVGVEQIALRSEPGTSTGVWSDENPPSGARTCIKRLSTAATISPVPASSRSEGARALLRLISTQSVGDGRVQRWASRIPRRQAEGPNLARLGVRLDAFTDDGHLEAVCHLDDRVHDYLTFWASREAGAESLSILIVSIGR